MKIESDLIRAKALLQMPHISLNQISKDTNIGYSTLRNYHINSEQLNRANYTTVSSLANEYDRLIKLEQSTDSINTLNEWLYGDKANKKIEKAVKLTIENNPQIYNHLVKNI